MSHIAQSSGDVARYVLSPGLGGGVGLLCADIHSSFTQGSKSPITGLEGLNKGELNMGE